MTRQVSNPSAKVFEELEDEVDGPKRWLVEVDYNTTNGTVTVDYHVEELLHLAFLIERGPDWNALHQVRITLNPERRTSAAVLTPSSL